MTSHAPTVQTPPVVSRLPNVGTTIFATMSALAVEKNAINLGQGFPDFSCDPKLIDAVTRAMQADLNQYPPMPGHAPLRAAIAAKVEAVYGRRYDVNSEITVTAGGTEAILSTILATVHPGDEVIVIEPSYDSYLPAIALAGGTPVLVQMLAPEFAIPFDAIKTAISPRTRLIIINTPNNPTGRIWRDAEMAQLAALVRDTSILILSDEVYEHMVYDGIPHSSAARHPELAARSFIVSSFGKTHHVTGWKVGYVLAPATLSAELRKVHQFNVFTVNTPMQAGIADYMADPATYLTLPDFYQHKRDLFQQGLAKTRFKVLPCEGTFFQCVDYADISDLNESDFCLWMINEVGVAGIPMSAFFQEQQHSRVIRFCFAKKDATLLAALERLASL